jgi:NAD(P)-dependent dehydrogenase (short-subunit alcohol dehydrogenase family)
MAALTRDFSRAQLAGTALADFTEPASIDALLGLLAKLRRVDVLVHAAGDYGFTKPGDTSTQTLETLLAVNVRAPYVLTQGLVPQLARAKGLVIFVNSSVVRSPGAGVAAYKASKHALQGLTDSLRHDLNERGIRVASLYPGQTATPQMRKIYAHRGTPYTPSKLLSASHVASVTVALAALPPSMEITDIHVRSVHRY